MAEEKKKPYSNPFITLAAIWEVLRRYASPENPLTVRQIYEHLKKMDPESAPSQSTLNRMLPDSRWLIRALFNDPMGMKHMAVSHMAYMDAGELRVVLETPTGETAGEANLEYTEKPFRMPSYSTIDNQLKNGILLDLDTFPFQLRCVAKAPGKKGALEYVPYDDWIDKQEPGAANNMPRRYYLENVLTEGEWRIFSDLVMVYPFITTKQTNKFLDVLKRLAPPRRDIQYPRYAFKRGNDNQFRCINLLDQAIDARRKVRLLYGEYILEPCDGKLTPVLRPREKNSRLKVSPYALMWSNGNYYLVCHHWGMMNLRVDRILDVELLSEVFDLPQNFDPVEYRDRSPVMHPGNPCFIRMRCKTSMLNILLDFFGQHPQYTTPTPDGFTEVTMRSAPSGVKLFALQYADGVEVLEPESLRNDIIRTMENALERYHS